MVIKPFTSPDLYWGLSFYECAFKKNYFTKLPFLLRVLPINVYVQVSSPKAKLIPPVHQTNCMFSLSTRLENRANKRKLKPVTNKK